MKTKNFWPLGIILTLAIFFVGCVGIVVLACSQRFDLVKSNYYSDEMQFQKTMDSRNRAQTMANQMAAVYDANLGQIKLSFSSAHPLNLSNGQIELYRPDEAKLDQNFDLKTDANGIQTIDVKNFRAGLWRIKISWTANGQNYLVEKHVVIGITNIK